MRLHLISFQWMALVVVAGGCQAETTPPEQSDTQTGQTQQALSYTSCNGSCAPGYATSGRVCDWTCPGSCNPYNAYLCVATSPRGSITASPATVVAAPNSVGSSNICWETANVGTAQVYVSVDGNAETLFGQAQSACQNAGWIQASHSYDFRLYSETSHSSRLSEVRVMGVPGGPIISVYANKCVGVENGNSADNTPVRLYDCNGTNAQSWNFAADNTIRALGKCLDVKNSGTTNGTGVQLYNCNGTGAQAWERLSDGSLRNPQSGRCLDDLGFNTANGAALGIWDCNGLINQKWTGP